jgi:hypothetical protein
MMTTGMTRTGWTRLPKKRLPNPKHGSCRPPQCTACGLQMTIKCRESHPERGPKHELQTFGCKCGQILKRDVASPGAA